MEGKIKLFLLELAYGNAVHLDLFFSLLNNFTVVKNNMKPILLLDF